MQTLKLIGKSTAIIVKMSYCHEKNLAFFCLSCESFKLKLIFLGLSLEILEIFQQILELLKPLQ